MTKVFSLAVANALLVLFATTMIAADKPAKPAADKTAAAEKKAPAKPAPEPVDTSKIVWPPELPGTKNGTVTLKTTDFLAIPEAVKTESEKSGAAPFVMAKSPPTVTLLFHGDLGPDPAGRTLWSAWGDIGLASDGKVYSGIGDHHKDGQGDARCFIYCYDPAKKTLEQIVDMNKVNPPKAGRPSWSKVHAKIDEGKDGKIYFSCTLNDGQRAKDPNYCKWDKDLPGGQIYSYDPKTQKVAVFATLPPAPRCTATSQVDAKRNIWWCNLEAGNGNALWGIELGTGKEIFKSDDGVIGFNRGFAIAKDGSIYFNGHSDHVAKSKAIDAQAEKDAEAAKVAAEKAAADAKKAEEDLLAQSKKEADEEAAKNKAAKLTPAEAKTKAAEAKAKAAAVNKAIKDARSKTAVAAKQAVADARTKVAKAKADAAKNQVTPLMKYDAKTHKIAPTKAEFVGTTGLRCMSRETSDGYIYGVTYGNNQLFRYSVKDQTIKVLGPTFLTGGYTTILELSPNEKYLYYLPGAHGQAHKGGTAVVQYEIATGQRKVLAFLGPAFEKAIEYTPSGTYGMKITPDGGTMYVNFNGNPDKKYMAPRMTGNGFGLTSFAVIEIPESERKE